MVPNNSAVNAQRPELRFPSFSVVEVRSYSSEGILDYGLSLDFQSFPVGALIVVITRLHTDQQGQRRLRVVQAGFESEFTGRNRKIKS